MSKGFIIVEREFFNSRYWQDDDSRYSFTEAWLDILRNVSFSSDDCTRRVGRYQVTWSKGEWPVSQRFLSQRWGWSMKRVRHFLTQLSIDGMISLMQDRAMTVIRLEKEGGEASVGEQSVSAGGTEASPARRCGDSEPIRNPVRPVRRVDKLEEEITQMREDANWQDLICTRCSLTKMMLHSNIIEFSTDCRCRGISGHKSLKEAKVHFFNWLLLRQRKEEEKTREQNCQRGGYRPTSADYVEEAQRRATEETIAFIRASQRRREMAADDASFHDF